MRNKVIAGVVFLAIGALGYFGGAVLAGFLFGLEGAGVELAFYNCGPMAGLAAGAAAGTEVYRRLEAKNKPKRRGKKNK